MRKSIKIAAGTVDRNNVAQVFITDDAQLNDKDLFEIKVVKSRYWDPGHVKAEIKYKGDVSSWYGPKSTTRKGSVTLPLDILINTTTRGLLESNYQLTAQETKKLLLAIVSGGEHKAAEEDNQ
jgi:hypothetical protein